MSNTGYQRQLFGFYNQENQFDFYRSMLAFLDKHLKPQETK